jgi:outer membrane receptor protein involved in Fe transport
VDYRYHYVSYSGSINYRVSPSLSTFARYSKGGRAGSDRLLFTTAIDPVDGSLAMKSAAYDPVKQAELGLKFRRDGIFVNATGFWAKVHETNTQLQPDSNGIVALQLISRSYRAFGAELEAGIRRGSFSLTGSATATSAKIIAADAAGLVGKTPRHQAPLIFQIMPQYDSDLFTVGATVIGSASSYSQDENLLKMKGYATVNTFLQVRPVEKVVVSLNVSNVFNTLAMTEVSAVSMPASHLALGRALLGRTIWSGVRYYF